MSAKERHNSRVHLVAPLPSLIQLFAGSALVVESDDVLDGADHVGHDEADARIEFAGSHPPWRRPDAASSNSLPGSRSWRMCFITQARPLPELGAIN